VEQTLIIWFISILIEENNSCFSVISSLAGFILCMEVCTNTNFGAMAFVIRQRFCSFFSSFLDQFPCQPYLVQVRDLEHQIFLFLKEFKLFVLSYVAFVMQDWFSSSLPFIYMSRRKKKLMILLRLLLLSFLNWRRHCWANSQAQSTFIKSNLLTKKGPLLVVQMIGPSYVVLWYMFIFHWFLILSVTTFTILTKYCGVRCDLWIWNTVFLNPPKNESTGIHARFGCILRSLF